MCLSDSAYLPNYRIARSNPQTEYWLSSRSVKLTSTREGLYSGNSNKRPSPLSGKFEKPELRVKDIEFTKVDKNEIIKVRNRNSF